MMWRDVVQLVRLDYLNDEYGDQQYIRLPITVFANKKSVRQSEFYQALATGLKPEIMFEVRSLEYTGQENLIYNLKEYVIIRTYSKNDEITELVCSGLVVKGEGF
jgi:SPP1 family predicted phage head-tail adaptor